MNANKAHKSNIQLIKAIWYHILPRRKFQIFLLFFVMLASSGLEVLSLLSIIPLLNFLRSPDSLWSNEFIRNNSLYFGLESANDLIFPVTMIFVLGTIISSLIKLLNLWLGAALSARIGGDLSRKLYRNNLYQEYSTQVERNSSEIVTESFIQLEATVSVVNQMLLTSTSLTLSLTFIGALLIYDWKVAVIFITTFGISYAIISKYTKIRIRKHSQFISDTQLKKIKAVSEGMGGIRDIILTSKQPLYLKRFADLDYPIRIKSAECSFLASFPKFSIEAIGYIFIGLLAFYLTLTLDDTSKVFPYLGVIALSAQKLLPNFQQIYGSWARIRAHNASVIKVLFSLDQKLPKYIDNDIVKGIQLRKNINLKNVDFRYGNDSKNIINNLNLVIKKGERIGITGSTGSGKSTLIDILIGLLEPSKGNLIVDDTYIGFKHSANLLRSWRSSISYVPQDIFLSDTSISENIAFGVLKDEINYTMVKESARRAQIANFIEDMPLKYETVVGERGIKLSGGQKQRIGIARAFYNLNKNPQVLILDEATSALDRKTESEVIKNIFLLGKDITIIMIAHRLSTIFYCDRVIKLTNGVIELDGTPEKVLGNPGALIS